MGKVFTQMKATGEITSPSKWVFSKARTILSERAREAKDWGKGSSGKGKGAKSGGGSYTLDELPGVMLDQQAYEKLGELSEEDLQELLEEYNVENERNGVRNPSGWLYGRARTKAIARISPAKAVQRPSPY